MTDKIFRTIAPTVFPVGVSTNWLNFHRLSLLFSCKSYQILWRCSCGTCIPNFIEIGAQEDSLCTFYCLVQRRTEIQRIFNKFQGFVSKNSWGYFFQLWYVTLYMKELNYHNAKYPCPTVKHLCSTDT